jgi:hypothetical protein
MESKMAWNIFACHSYLKRNGVSTLLQSLGHLRQGSDTTEKQRAKRRLSI